MKSAIYEKNPTAARLMFKLANEMKLFDKLSEPEVITITMNIDPPLGKRLNGDPNSATAGDSERNWT